jgi:protein-S-isoprenylcysteine O-methyltransferase Ste14
METSRFFEWFLFWVLACWGLLGLMRVLLFRARGISVIVADRQRTVSQMVADALASICLLVWAYEIVAYVWHFYFHVGPVGLHRVLVESVIIETVGAIVVSAAFLLYVIALHHLGKSWRLGIDRTTPGPLVTGSIYRWTRHPIYVAFDLLFVGTFLVLGHLIFLVLALVWIPLLHGLMLREERFLIELYDGAYRDYCRHVGRYFSWHRYEREPNAV